MLDKEDRRWLMAAFKLKAKRPSRPVASNFRVAAIVTYVDNVTDDSKIQVKYVTGANEETAFIGTGCCAERSALLQLANIRYTRVLAVYLVSDSQSILTPGLLCRDFITHYIKDGEDIKVVMGSEVELAPEGFIYQVSYISKLYPLPHNYIGIPGPKTGQYAQSFAKTVQSLPGKYNDGSENSRNLLNLYSAVIQATCHDIHDYLHPIRYAAGVLLCDGSIVIGHQSKLSEYGYTTDAVTALVTLLTQPDSCVDKRKKALFLMQSDQYGVLHAPFGPARCHLRETVKNNEDNRLLIVCHDQKGLLQSATVKDLCPDFPDVKQGLKQSSKL